MLHPVTQGGRLFEIQVFRRLKHSIADDLDLLFASASLAKIKLFLKILEAAIRFFLGEKPRQDVVDAFADRFRSDAVLLVKLLLYDPTTTRFVYCSLHGRRNRIGIQNGAPFGVSGRTPHRLNQ